MKQFFTKITTVLSLMAGITSSAQAQQEPFPCNEVFYIVNGTGFYEYDPIGGGQVFISTIGNVNALAFAKSSFLYGYDQAANSVVRIGLGGTKVPLAVPGLPTGNIPGTGPNFQQYSYNTGAADTSGYVYLYDGNPSYNGPGTNSALRFYTIDTDTTRATYGQLVDPSGGVVPYPLDTRSPSGTRIVNESNNPIPANNIRQISDWVFNLNDGLLYSITNNQSDNTNPRRMVTFNPVTGQMLEITGNINGGTPNFNNTSSYGAMFMTADGVLYAFHNQNGHVYRINVSGSSATAERVSNTALSSSNLDGANCPTATSIVLPVTLISFDAYKKGGIVQLDWATAKEHNNKGFEIERSADGSNWIRIGFVSSQAENGNSNFRLNYNFTDMQPLGGRSMYRFRQVDFDAKYIYSPVRLVSFDKGNNTTIYPNPAKESVTISGLQGNEQVKVYNTLGIMVHQQKAAHSTMNVSLAHLSAGIYHISIITADGVVTSNKIVKSN